MGTRDEGRRFRGSERSREPLSTGGSPCKEWSTELLGRRNDPFEISLKGRAVRKGSDLLVAALENEGVERIFGVPGEENLDVVESLRNSKIELVLTRHEQAAAFMAATHGRLTGKPGVCMSTLGPGALNLSTGAAYAHLGAMPNDHDHGAKGNHDGETSAVPDCRCDRLHAASNKNGSTDRQSRIHPGNCA